MARTVASQGKCGGLEDYDVKGQGAWEFTCQRGDGAFVIRAAGSDESRDASVQRLAQSRVAYKTGEFFVVWPMLAPGQPADPESLRLFPGDLVAPQ